MLSANQIQEVKEQAYCGVPSTLPGVCKIYPFSINQIVAMGTINYNSKLGTLLLTEVDIAEMIKEKIDVDVPLEEINVFEYLVQSANNNDSFLLELQSIFSTFTKEEVLILPKINSILIGPMSEKRLITKENFPDFQDILRIQNRREVKEPPPKDETPGQRKMRLLREKVAEVKKKQAEKDGEGQTLDELMEVAETFGVSLDKSLYAFYGLIRRHQLKEKWDQDIAMICAGADGKKMKTKYWGSSSKDD